MKRFFVNLWDSIWKSRQRKVDETILWPSICEQADTLDQAKRAMRKHMDMDSAYSNMRSDDKEKHIQHLGRLAKGRFP